MPIKLSDISSTITKEFGAFFSGHEESGFREKFARQYSFWVHNSSSHSLFIPNSSDPVFFPKSVACFGLLDLSASWI